MRTMRLFLFITAVTSGVESARILALVPFPAKSHQRVIQPLLKELASRGHHVTFLSPVAPDNPPSNLNHVPIEDYTPIMKKDVSQMLVKSNDGVETIKRFVSYFMMLSFKGFGVKFTEWVYDQKEIQDIIKSNERFDAVILETTFFQESLVGLGHRFNASVIEYSPAGIMLWSYWLHGSPFDTSYFGEGILPFSHHMTLFQKTVNTILNLVTRLVWYNYYIPQYQRVMDEKLRYDGWESRPSMMTMVAETSLFLVNTHYSVNYPYPVATNFIEVGGLNIEQAKPLPKDLQRFMDDATEGVIYFTLGSHIDVSGVLDGKLKDVFTKVFSQLKQKILWKWETDFANPPSNVKISKWFPQQDILGHKNLKLFITHGGFLSATEAINEGVPTIGIPLFADQFKNVEHMKFFKYGVHLDLNNITYDSLTWAINEALDNPMYAENAKKQSKIFRDKPETALETAVYWTEYVIRHKGAEHLRPAIATMPWYQQAMIDVYSAMAAILLITLYLTYKSITCFLKLICKFRRMKKETSNTKKKQ